MELTIMFGVAGAVLDNMLSQEPFVVSTGATLRHYACYLFVKPLIGAFAALFFLLFEKSGVLFDVLLTGTPSRAAIQIEVETWQAASFTLAMLSVAAGYFADRMLSSVMDRTLNLLFEKSEKGVPTAGLSSRERDLHSRPGAVRPSFASAPTPGQPQPPLIDTPAPHLGNALSQSGALPFHAFAPQGECISTKRRS